MLWPSPLPFLWKRINPLRGAQRVGGVGSGHEGSEWVRVASTVEADLPDYGAKTSLVLARGKHQVKVWAPQMGTFVVHPSRVARSEQSLSWNRRDAAQTVPRAGSLVNVKRAHDVSQWMAKLNEDLSDSDEPVNLEVGTPGRRAQSISVNREAVIGPHLPTKIKGESGWVKDALRRRGDNASPLDDALDEAALEVSAPALEWAAFVPRERRARMEASEAAWMDAHRRDVETMARAQCARLGLPRADEGDVAAEALRGALAALRVWERNPAKARAVTLEKLARDKPELDATTLDEDELRTRRALWRAYSHARRAALAVSHNRSSAIEFASVAPRGGAPKADAQSVALAAFDSLHIAIELADLSEAARYLLFEALRASAAGKFDLQSAGARFAPPDVARICATLHRDFDATHATPESLPGMWLFVRNRLRDASNQSESDVTGNLLAKSLFHDWEHPRLHGKFVNKLRFHHPPNIFYAPAPDNKGGSSATPMKNIEQAPTIIRGQICAPTLKQIFDANSHRLAKSWYQSVRTPSAEQLATVLEAMEPHRKRLGKFKNWLEEWNDGKSRQGNELNFVLLALQLAAKDEFSTPFPYLAREQNLQGVQELYSAQKVSMRAFVRAMYRHTQSELKRQKIDGMLSWRGVKGNSKGYPFGFPDNFSTDGFENNPLVPFTLRLEQAKAFASVRGMATEKGAIFCAYIPASRIIGTPLTGFGVIAQTELVASGGISMSQNAQIGESTNTPDDDGDRAHILAWNNSETGNRLLAYDIEEWAQYIEEHQQ